MVGVLNESSLRTSLLPSNVLLVRDPKSWPTACSSSQYSALNNKLGQDPCQIANALWTECFGPISSINPPHLNELQNNPCLCNTVFYSLAYVCGACSNAGFLQDTLSDYSHKLGCSSVPQTYSHFVPPGTTIPPWAYLPVTGDKVDIQHAEQAAGQGGANSATLSDPAPASQPPPPTSVVPTPSTANSANTGPGPATSSPKAHTPPSSSILPTDTSDRSQSTPPTSLSQVSSAATTPTLTTAGTPSRSDSRSSASDSKDESFATIHTTPTRQAGAHGASDGTSIVSSTTLGGPTLGAVASRRSHLGAILGGVFAAIVAAILAVCIIVFLARRRRRRLEKEAMLAVGPLNWWRRPHRPTLQAADRAPSLNSTIKGEDLEDDDDMETLHAMSEEKKSVTYGGYPDL